MAMWRGRSACVVGGGVVGLAVARQLARSGAEVVLAERQGLLCQGISARNSGVVHGGMYYPSGSLKASCCVAGRRELYAFCDAHGVPYRKRGKLIVATDEVQLAVLDTILKRALVNGLEGEIERIDGAEATALEPELRCLAALWSPQTGVVDVPAFGLALQADAEAHGATVARGAVEKIEPGPGGAGVQVCMEGGEMLAFDMAVNCAGLGAVALAEASHARSGGWKPPAARFAKGNYFSLSGSSSPFERLVYPVPQPGGLGVHVTIDLDGRARFGPDVEWLADDTPPDAIDYAVDPARADAFYDAVRAYWPGLPDDALQPDYAGVRPKLCVEGEQDFVLAGPAQHGVRGLVHALGVESPGLTSSLALAKRIEALL